MCSDLNSSTSRTGTNEERAKGTEAMGKEIDRETDRDREINA